MNSQTKEEYHNGNKIAWMIGYLEHLYRNNRIHWMNILIKLRFMKLNQLFYVRGFEGISAYQP